MRIFLILLLLITPLAASETKAPTLTDEQKALVERVVQRIEIAQLRLQNAQLVLQLAQQNFESEKASVQTALKGLEKEGYSLDLNKLAYVPAEKK